MPRTSDRQAPVSILVQLPVLLALLMPLGLLGLTCVGCATTVQVDERQVDERSPAVSAQSAAPAGTAGVASATVKIRSTRVRPSYFYPWEAQSHETSWGSGVLIEGGVILTNAHVVADTRYLTVERTGDPRRYEAEVLFAGHDCDLALIRVSGSAFRRGMEPVRMARELPPLGSTVATYGFPIGGSALSVTQGVVSRIDVETYAHDADRSFLAIQTDAAINPGNSGGPVALDGEVVGIAFQYQPEAENQGYVIPVPVIRRFLADVEDGGYDGFPELGIVAQGLESRALRSSLGMEPGETGVLVNRVIPGGSAAGRLRDGDVILSLDGKPVANDGTVEIDGDRWPLSVYVSLKPPGETLRVGVLRPPGSQPGAPGGEPRTTVTLHPAPTRHRIPRHNQYDSLPRYVVYGGIVFQPLTREYLKLWDRWWEEADRRLAYYWTYGPEDRPHPAREELVLINTVLPDRATSVHAGVMDEVVDSINGIRIDSLDDVLPALRAPLRGFVVIEFDSGRCPLVVRADALEEAHGRIMERYGIPREGAR